MLKTLLSIPLIAASASAAQPLTAQQVIERIQKNVGVPWSAQTVDTFKAGRPDTRVAGIVTAFTATMDVLKRAAFSRKNLIITHEPTYYNHLDSTAELESDAVLKAKRAFIEKYNLVIWRFHDHWHMRRPDGILAGMTRALGWEEYKNPEDPALFNVPGATLEKFAAGLRDKLQIRTIRVIGDPRMMVSKVAFAPGAAPSSLHFRLLARKDVDVLVVGEAREWETVEYVRDSANTTQPKALVILGHVASEEAGMEECARWLRTFITEVPVGFLVAGEPYWAPK